MPPSKRKAPRNQNAAESAGSPGARHAPLRALHPEDPARLLLARILAFLLGLLLGALTVHYISVMFTEPVQRQLDQSREQIAQAERNIEELEPRITKLSREQTEVQRRVESLTEEYARAIGELRTEIGEQLDTARQQWGATDAQVSPLRSQRDEHQSVIRFQRDNQIPELRRDVFVLNLLSFAVMVIFTLLGYLSYPLFLRLLSRSLETWSALQVQGERRAPHLLIGFFAGLILAVLVLLGLFTTFSDPSSPLGNPAFRLIFGSVFVIVMGMAGSLVAVNYFGPGPRRVDPYRQYRAVSSPKLLDTSVLIDGRIHEVASSGFLDGALIVLNSVLRELQSLADSSDGRKRAKGRRGLELVRTMQDDPRVDLRVFDDGSLHETGRPTDEQLIAVAHEMEAAVVTNDYNLNRVAAILKVPVVNLNALANAVKTRHVPGDIIEIEIIDRGKQRGQGVGYLEDGTMVVIEDGEPFIRETRNVKLTSVTQTVQGRLIFGRVDLAEEEADG